MIFILHFFLLFSVAAWAKGTDICDLLDLKNCSGVSKLGRRTSLVSLPSPTSASILNPATVSFDRGLGIESITQTGNPTVFNLATGTGKIGGALISSSLENTFFGNRVYELDDSFLKRHINKKQYKTNKYSLALGGKIFRKKNVSLDLGIILKRHSEIKRINPGVGLSARIGPLTLGASIYQDDFYLDLAGHSDPTTGIPYTVIFNDTIYTERFVVTTYSIGTKISSFAFDTGVIKTKYEVESMDTEIHLYSGSYILGDFMFNLAYRTERSAAPKFIDDTLKYVKPKNAAFGGVQASLGQHFIVGVNYNYFLLKELSVMATFFL